jgi:glycosidase
MEFHISRQSREKFQFDDTLFALDGNVLFADLYSVRLFASKINQQRDLTRFPEQTARAGQINALGLMDEIFHHLFFLYRQQKNLLVIPAMLQSLEKSLGREPLDSIFLLFVKEFPPASVYKKESTAEDYLVTDTKGVPNRNLILEELVLYWITQQNPALDQYAELFESPQLTESREFTALFTQLNEFFADQPPFGPENLPLLDLMRSPAHHVPHSLTGQLEYIRDHWASLLGDYFYRLLSGLDYLKEENKLSFGGPGPVPVPVYDRKNWLANGAAIDRIAFSQDREWMPGLVLMAKNTYVWLDQLSKKYQQDIHTLDQIPQEELDTLAESGISGLWLIGLWERSRASATIKQLCGNPDAIASAYSLYSYEIAADLGGQAAYEKLREKTNRCGLRLASDMVPNHMGIDSEWVLHHPERFLSVAQSPYPNYTFTGPDLSGDPSVTLQIEDHYYSRTDAAVVFKRYDHYNGETKYIYHGNDGTSMPWNDTAQLNYLSHEVQEAVYQTILEVARKFPIIRFDAAMTLAKKQVQRLWFPEPGSGGAIPSRSEHAMTAEQFDTAMPEEFWRMVVDRMAVDAPDTLLLAEAFWMMEGYFVRSLGMHRVYNSAFMHMLRDENNAGYRQLIKNTLEFEPEILKRYVNFMNNPDERTAIDQFGKGDKYFGVCTLMATFPGLPMLGHGQIEGFAEKYGMEYRHAYQNETVDTTLVERHQREIFPLLRKRRLFSGVENFWLFDFFTTNGHVNENVFAFTNACEDQRALVIVNNSLHSSEGWLKTSSSRLSDGNLTQRSLSDCLDLHTTTHKYLLFLDQISGLQYIRRVEDLRQNGFHMRLSGYEYHVFYDFQLVSSDSQHDYHRLADYLGEGGIPEIQSGLTELFIQPVLQPFRELINTGYFNYLDSLLKEGAESFTPAVADEAREKLSAFLHGIEKTTQQALLHFDVSIQSSLKGLQTVIALPALPARAQQSHMKKLENAAAFLEKSFSSNNLHTLLGWTLFGQMGLSNAQGNADVLSLSWADEWQLYKTFAALLRKLGNSESEANHAITTLKLLTTQHGWYRQMLDRSAGEVLKYWLTTPEILDFLHVNRFEDVLWYDHDAMLDFSWWMTLVAYLDAEMDPQATSAASSEALMGAYSILQEILKADQDSGYQIEKLLELLKA